MASHRHEKFMKLSFYHVCISSENEVFFRDEADYIRGFNCLALAIERTGSVLLADAFMSNHVHFCVQTNQLKDLVWLFRTYYYRYFNSRYKRKGPLGDQGFSAISIEGPKHCTVAISYVLRNPLHHGVTSTPFEYRYSSVCNYFKKQLGHDNFVAPATNSRFKGNLPANVVCPDSYKIEPSGQISRDSVIDIGQVEHLFQTPQQFMLYMVRRTSKKWREEQEDDTNETEPVSLELLESNRFDVSSMENNEKFKFQITTSSDESICQIIDYKVIGRYDCDSIYQLSLQQKVDVAKYLKSEYSCSNSQLARCLAVDNDSFYKLLYQRK